jgi:hypothetical protein
MKIYRNLHMILDKHSVTSKVRRLLLQSSLFTLILNETLSIYFLKISESMRLNFGVRQ